MALIEFAILSAINLGLVLYIIRRWGIISAEGLCMAYLGAAILTDNLELVFHYIVSPDVLPLGYGEFAFRLYPTAIHILGLLVFILALITVNPRPAAIDRPLQSVEQARLRNLGIIIAVVGLLLTAVAVYLVGALSAPNFYAAFNAFRSQALPYGGFWYRGADVIVFGLALTLPSLKFRSLRFLGVLALMMFFSFFLRTNKGGLEEPLLWAGAVIYVYDRSFFKTLFRFRNLALACSIALFGMGAKLWFLPYAMNRADNAPPTIVRLVDLATSTAATRWGDDSLYRGYCQFVNSLPENRNLFSGHKVGTYVLTSWIPRFLFPRKPDHPFRGLGFMIYSDYHTFPSETPAPTLIGSVMADGGILTMSTYLFLTGIFLSIFRLTTTQPSCSIYSHAGYVLFALFGGLSAEEGILGIFYTLFLAYGVIGAALLIQQVWRITNTRWALTPTASPLSNPPINR